MSGMPYGALLASAAGAPAPAPPQIPGPTPLAGPGAKPPMPDLPGLPPPPTNTGAMNTGVKSPKDAASDAILALRDLKSHFPAMAMQLDGTIEAIKTATKPGGVAGGKAPNDGVKASTVPPAGAEDKGGGDVMGDLDAP